MARTPAHFTHSSRSFTKTSRIGTLRCVPLRERKSCTCKCFLTYRGNREKNVYETRQNVTKRERTVRCREIHMLPVPLRSASKFYYRATQSARS